MAAKEVRFSAEARTSTLAVAGAFRTVPRAGSIDSDAPQPATAKLRPRRLAPIDPDRCADKTKSL